MHITIGENKFNIFTVICTFLLTFKTTNTIFIHIPTDSAGGHVWCATTPPKPKRTRSLTAIVIVRHKLNSGRFAIQMCTLAEWLMLTGEFSFRSVYHCCTCVRKMRETKTSLLLIFCARTFSLPSQTRPASKRANNSFGAHGQKRPDWKPELNWILNRCAWRSRRRPLLKSCGARAISPILALNLEHA